MYTILKNLSIPVIQLKIAFYIFPEYLNTKVLEVQLKNVNFYNTNLKEN